MEPWQSWLVVGMVAIATWLYYNRQTKRKPASKTKGALLSEDTKGRSQRRRDNVKEKQRPVLNGSASPSGSETPVLTSAATPGAQAASVKQLKKRPGKKGPSDPVAVSSAVDTKSGIDGSGAVNTTNEGMDNKELAERLSSLKTGSSLAPPPQTTSNRKPGRPRGKAKPMTLEEFNRASGQQATSTESSVGGMDADDDLSSRDSPAMKATSPEQGSNSLDVSDMLETPGPGPSVLRITDPNQPRVQKQPQQPKVAQVSETKKQRQNRLKKEAKKMAREEAEKGRRALLEKQLRTAREAEGRPAKDGSASAGQPLKNAWTTPVVPANTHDPSPAVADTTYAPPLLDTFDKAGPKEGDSRDDSGVDVEKAAKAWERDLPSEEDQLRMIQELNGDEGGWKTVGKRRRRKTSSGDATATNSSSSDAGSTSAQNGPSDDASRRSHPNDSDWAVV